MFWQLYEGLCQAILAGQFLPGSRLPPTRVLADHLKVSRNTVHLAYRQLVDEGYLEGRQGSGTRVSQSLPDQLPYRGDEGAFRPVPAQGERAISQRGTQLLAAFGQDCQDKRGLSNALMPGGPAFDQFPHKIWQRLLVRSWQNLAHGALASAGADYRPLCEGIASHLGTTRGVRCTAEQVVMVAGSQQGLDLALRVLLDPGDAAWIEDPCYRGAYGAMLGAGIKPVAVAVDGEGLQVGTGQRLREKARLAYVTPSYQYPMGMTMSLGRRLQLLEWAGRNQAWILEDDYHSDFRYTGRPLAALQGLDQQRRVVYLGTFSKVLFPSLRLAYLVVPPDLVEAFLAVRDFSCRCPPLLTQATLADFISEGHFARHIRRMCRLYATRQRAFIEVAPDQTRWFARAGTGGSRDAPIGLAARGCGRLGGCAPSSFGRP